MDRGIMHETGRVVKGLDQVSSIDEARPASRHTVKRARAASRRRLLHFASLKPPKPAAPAWAMSL